jgi:serine protease
VYVVFWGSQWGSVRSTDSSGNPTSLSADYAGGVPYIENLFKGLGTGGELWSGTMTQYCDGSVSAGATSCPSGALHILYPTGGTLAGIWYDSSAAAPSTASAGQIGQEAIVAAAHFGHTDQAANRDVQYDILSAPGANPDNYLTSGFCAWHDFTGDGSLGISSKYGDLAFTNMPYVMDVGYSCGANFVNAGSAGTVDGYSIVNGHEYAETITDQNPAGGWTNHQNNSFSGEENGDECAWISSGQGAAGNVAMSDGSFAMQSTWSNDTNQCDLSHPVFSANTVTVNSPGNQSTPAGTTVNGPQITGSDSASGQTLTYSATGLPSGLSISSSGLIAGTVSASAAPTNSVTVTATDGTGARGSTLFTWAITGTKANIVTVTNPGSQTSRLSRHTSLQIRATDSGGSTLTYSASGLPSGLSINPSTGLISGTPTKLGTYSVTVTGTDTTAAKGSTTFSWTVARR